MNIANAKGDLYMPCTAMAHSTKYISTGQVRKTPQAVLNAYGPSNCNNPCITFSCTKSCTDKIQQGLLTRLNI